MDRTNRPLNRQRKTNANLLCSSEENVVCSFLLIWMDLALLKAPQSFEQGVKDINACSTGDVAEELVR